MAPDELILLMGGPGSGKGTTGKILARQYGAELRSTGQLIREENDPDLMAFLDRGDLAPEKEIERVLTSAILNLKGKPLILDGATKMPNEAKWLLDNLAEFGRRLTVVIFLDVGEELARQRILSVHRGRDDDAPEFQEHRWNEFRTHTLESIDVYRQAGLLETVKVDATPEEIVLRMLAIVDRRQQASAGTISGQFLDRNPENLREIDRPIAAVIIISGDNKILMGRKDPAKGGVYAEAWHLPGGGVDDGESLEAAARREGLEEVGLDLTDQVLDRVPFIGQGETTKTLETGEKVWCTMTFNRFEVSLNELAVDIKVQPGDDFIELRWFDETELHDVKQIPGGMEFFIQAGYIQAVEAVD
jgi:adenylate kinase family enzyme/8-oxo-dGTP pyrophosphatase MutT (NUDIX family)